ncbi:hypothetical protein [Natronoglomus mannanivorans]|uniref:DUF2975 domain-containing protein n=1 Tax=Natronoglomus mannanivorans TaxID=2979990 RepID=A0AAP2YY99_9EURY|nr:hypothetical protein [Halobacteria archaeon AArc-xg1-1]
MAPDLDSETRTRALVAAVSLGAVVLVAVPSTFVLSSFFVSVLEPVVESLGASDLWLLAAPAFALLIGLQLAAEAAALRLHGLAALRHGGRRLVFARHLVVAITTALAVGLVTWYSTSLVVANSWVVAVLGGLVAVAALVAIVYESTAFAVDHRSNEQRL